MVAVPLAIVAAPIIAGFSKDEPKELTQTTRHHLVFSSYLLDYQKKSALTGSLQRPPSGLGFGYDVRYEYDSAKLGILGYGNFTWQESDIASDDWARITNYFVKTDAQIGWDLARFLSSQFDSEFWSWQRAYFRIGPSFFHDFIRLADVGTGNRQAFVDHPNIGAGLVTALGYEMAAEVDLRFPYDVGGLQFTFERGSYPSLTFPQVTPSEAVLITMVAFDDLRAGSSYTWQRLRLELEVPAVFTRKGGFQLGAQTFAYENNRGSGVDNRGFDVTYTWRWE